MIKCKKLLLIQVLFIMIILLSQKYVFAYPVHPPEHYDHYWALLVGADEWANEPVGIQEGLKKWYNWNTIGTIEYITNPSNTALLDKVFEYTTKVGEDDFFFFWYSGHGSYDKVNPQRQDEQVAASNALDKYDESLWGSVSGINVYDDQLADFNFLGGIKGDKLSVFASCFSGGMWGGNDSSSPGDLEQLTKIGVYASSSELQTTAGVSSFVNGLIEGLSSKNADLNDDLHLTIGEWYIYGDSKNAGELVSTINTDGTWDGSTAVDPQYFDHNNDMQMKYVAYDNVPEPATIILLFSGLLGLAGLRKKSAT